MIDKVVLITEIISPYRIPVFNEISRCLGDKFCALFFSINVKERGWKINKKNIEFNYEILQSIAFRIHKNYFPFFLSPAIFFTLFRRSPKLIILGGYHHPSFILAMFYAKLFRKNIILWCESNKYDQRSCHFLEEIYKRLFVRWCDGFIVPGKASFDYVLSLGASPGKVWRAQNAVDNDYFGVCVDKYRESKEKFKQSKGYPKKLILYVGRLIQQKGVLDLLKAFQALSGEHSDTGLLLVGNGGEEQGYKEFCRVNNIKNVFFPGFIQQDELPVYYAACDVFVLPTHSDPWGLVLNEAMASKLPVISSDVAGAARDLISHGENGYIFRKGDILQLIGYLKDVLNDEHKRIKMGQKSFEIIQDYSPVKCAQGFIKAMMEV